MCTLLKELKNTDKFLFEIIWFALKIIFLSYQEEKSLDTYWTQAKKFP